MNSPYNCAASVLLWAKISVGLFKTCMIFAIVKILPEPVTPSKVWHVLPVKFAVPSFLFTQLMSAFLRNDGAPGLATRAVIFGGIFDVFGDYFFVFVMDFGIFGAGLVLSAVISLAGSL